MRPTMRGKACVQLLKVRKGDDGVLGCYFIVVEIDNHKIFHVLRERGIRPDGTVDGKDEVYLGKALLGRGGSESQQERNRGFEELEEHVRQDGNQYGLVSERSKEGHDGESV